MARRDGQITAKGERRWLVRWFLARDQGGRRRYSSKTIHGTKRDAQKYLNSVLRSRDLGVYVEPARVTLNQYLDKWLETAAKPRVAPRTLGDYKVILKTYVRPQLGDRRLDQIRLLDVQGLVTQMLEKGLSPRTIRLAHAILGSAFKQAQRWGMLITNPVALVELPKQRRREMQALSQAAIKKFREASAGTSHAVLFDFLLATGCRPGEAQALRWSDLNLKAEVARIVRALSKEDGRPAFKETKTGKGRAIPLPRSVVRALAIHRRVQAERAMKLGPAYARDLDLVFANELGLPLDLRNVVHRYFKPIVKKAKLPGNLRLYDLRHTCATLLLAGGVHPKVVAERLGHASTRMTLDVYSHVLPGMQEEATAQLGRVLFGE